MKQYLELLKDIQTNGIKKADRTGVGTKSVFGRQLRFDLDKGFPAMTTKKLFMRAVIHELIWFLQGSTNIKYLVDNDVHIWDEWAWKRYHKAALSSKGKMADMNQTDFIANWVGKKIVVHVNATGLVS